MVDSHRQSLITFSWLDEIWCRFFDKAKVLNVLISVTQMVLPPSPCPDEEKKKVWQEKYLTACFSLFINPNSYRYKDT